MCDVKRGICQTNCHIEKAKNEIVEKVEQHKSQCEAFHNETKEEIANAIDNINGHLDDKFSEADFDRKFSDLNEQIKSMNNLELGVYSNG